MATPLQNVVAAIPHLSDPEIKAASMKLLAQLEQDIAEVGYETSTVFDLLNQDLGELLNVIDEKAEGVAGESEHYSEVAATDEDDEG